MQICYSDVIRKINGGFEIKEQRIYKMPKKGTFFGIHYQDRQAKIISVIQGGGIDYIVDLRRDSPTYKQYRTVKLCGDDDVAVFIPSGFGHGFLSLEDNTIQLFTVDKLFSPENSKALNYKALGIELPRGNIIISPKDKDAPFSEL